MNNSARFNVHTQPWESFTVPTKPVEFVYIPSKAARQVMLARRRSQHRTMMRRVARWCVVWLAVLAVPVVVCMVMAP